MTVEISYCPTRSGYDRRAASLAAEIEGSGIGASAIPGEKSQFDVVRDGELIFSKQREGRFPEHDEILAALAA